MTHAPDVDPHARLEAWRASGLDRVDPVRFRVLEALARRAAASGGVARQAIEARLAAWVMGYAARLDWEGAGDGVAAVSPDASGESLRLLVREVDARRGRIAAAAPAVAAGAAASIRRASPPPKPPVPAVAEPLAPDADTTRFVQRTWSRLNAGRRLKQALAGPPGNAGPLHSHALVVRALRQMNEASPEYLAHFLGYVDTLLWLEDAGDEAASSPR